MASVIKNLKSPLVQTLIGIGGGAGLGKLLADFENQNIYTQKPTKNVSSLMGPATGSLIGGIIANPILRKKHLGTALAAAAALAGAKQMGLAGLDTIDRYTSIQNELADKNTQITKNQLDTALANKEIANTANEMSKKWLNLAKTGIPIAGGIGGILTALYAYNALKDKKQPITLKIDNKPSNRDKGSMYLEIPSEKISDKFYNAFSRELLFKDDREKYLSAKEKEKNGMNLTSKEKNIIEKFEKAASTLNIDTSAELSDKNKQKFVDKLQSDLDFDSAIFDINKKKNQLNKDKSNLLKDTSYPMWEESKKKYDKKLYYNNPTAAFLNEGTFGLTKAIRENYKDLSQDEQALLFEHIKDKNTPFIQKIISMLLPMLQGAGIVPTPNTNK